MKFLIGTTIVTNAKDYAVAKFEEQVEKVFFTDRTSHQIDVLAITDNKSKTWLPSHPIESNVSIFATDIIYHGKEQLKKVAIEEQYDAIVWQGIDCYYDTVDDFLNLLGWSEQLHIVGALIAGRDKENYPVCREFRKEGDKYTRLQNEIPPSELQQGKLLQVPGYIGSDATIITRNALETITMDGYLPWHLVHQNIEGALGPEEWFMWSAVQRHGFIPCCDTSIRPWHAHETGRTVRYPGEVKDLNELSWD